MRRSACSIGSTPHLFRAVNHNPIQFLVNLPSERIAQLAQDQGFLFELERVWEQFQEYMRYDSRVPHHAAAVLGRSDTVAYFSMEFGLHECIPIYGGGLGVLAGDFLKAASDLNLPIVGVGLVYKYGYFTQRINMKGEQEEQFIEFDNHLVPMHEVRGPDGREGLRRSARSSASPSKIKLWQIDVGKIR